VIGLNVFQLGPVTREDVAGLLLGSKYLYLATTWYRHRELLRRPVHEELTRCHRNRRMRQQQRPRPTAGILKKIG